MLLPHKLNLQEPIDLLALRESFPEDLRKQAVVPLYVQENGLVRVCESRVSEPEDRAATVGTQHYAHPKDKVTLWFNLYPNGPLDASEGVGGCGEHCTHCYYPVNPHHTLPHTHLEASELSDLIQRIQENPDYLCRVTAAEYLSPHLEGFWDAGVFSTTPLVTTSGRTLREDPERSKALMDKHGIKSVQLTLHERYPSDEQNLWRGANYERVQKSVRAVRKWGDEYTITGCVVLGKHNYQSVMSWIDSAYKEYGVDAIRFSRVLPTHPRLFAHYLPEDDATYAEIALQIQHGREKYDYAGDKPMGVHLSGIMGQYQPGYAEMEPQKQQRYMCSAAQGKLYVVWGQGIYNCLEVRNTDTLVGVVAKNPTQLIHITNAQELGRQKGLFHGCHGHQIAEAQYKKNAMREYLDTLPKIKHPHFEV